MTMLHHVLVIDDEKEVRDVVRLQLGGTRYEMASRGSNTSMKMRLPWM